MLNYKQNITKLPVYNDGSFNLYEIKQTTDDYPIEYIKNVAGSPIWYEELSISDRLRFESEERNVQITYKIRIPQNKQITSFHVCKIENTYHKVYNAYHFTDKDGFRKTDLTLVRYPRVKLEGEIDEQRRSS